MKYQLPEVVQLKQIGFKFKHSTINDFFTYTKDFINKHDDNLFNILIHDFDLEEYESTITRDKCNAIQINDADERINRLLKGIINTDDYRFIVHPVHKKKSDVLLNTWVKRKIKFGLDSKVLLNYPKIFGLSPIEAIHLTLLNELYRIIIWKLPPELFIPFPKYFESKYQADISKLYDKLYKLPKTANKSLMPMVINNSIEKLKEAEYEDFFNRNLSTKERVNMHYFKIATNFKFHKISQTTHLEEKEKVIRNFLKTQTSVVTISKNTRGKGLHDAKKNRIILYFTNFPDSNNSEAAKDLKVSRNTIRKHKPD